MKRSFFKKGIPFLLCFSIVFSFFTVSAFACHGNDSNQSECKDKHHGLYIPAYNRLKVIEKLPDPFKFYNGKRVKSKADWQKRRNEISAFAQEFEYGIKPPKPDNVTGAVYANKLTVTCTENGKSISFICPIQYPTTGTAPYPAIIANGMSVLDNKTILGLGVAIINFPCDVIAAQNGTSSRGTGKFYDLYGSDHSAGAFMAGAWGVSRLIDALEITPDAKINAARLGVTGGSRYGKGALVIGAFDERIKLTIPQESGTGGAGSWRVCDALKENGVNVQTLSAAAAENCWYRENFSQFANTATKLPFDQHMIEGLCAPRGLLVIENPDYTWLGCESTFITANAAHKIYEALGVPNNMGFSAVGNHGHCQFPSSQVPELTAFIQKFLLGDTTANTAIMKTAGEMIFDIDSWIDWKVPKFR